MPLAKRYLPKEVNKIVTPTGRMTYENLRENHVSCSVLPGRFQVNCQIPTVCVISIWVFLQLIFNFFLFCFTLVYLVSEAHHVKVKGNYIYYFVFLEINLLTISLCRITMLEFRYVKYRKANF